jgi:hypothetical protein
MNMFPILLGTPPLSVGVEIRYEEFDAEPLMHMLCFLEDHEKHAKGTFVLIPAIGFDGATSNIQKIKKSLESFPEGGRCVNGYVSVYFLDEMRQLFEAYIRTLNEIKEGAEAEFAWDEDHEFFPLLFYFQEIEKIFFPKKIGMH